MRPINLTKAELQQMYLRYNAGKMARVFGYKTHEMYTILRENGILAPTDYLRTIDRYDLWWQLAECGSTKLLAKKYRVSESFLKTIIVPGFKQPGADRVKGVLEATGSTKIAADIFGLTLDLFKKVMKHYNIENPKNPVKGSHVTYLFGREGELDYMHVRALRDECDMTKSNPNHPFDVMDPQYGRVNVKSSKEIRYKQRSLKAADKSSFKFHLSGLKDSDHIALMCYHKNGYVAIYVVPCVFKLFSEGKTFILNYKNLQMLKPFELYFGVITHA